jgi:hypothetical protein
MTSVGPARRTPRVRRPKKTAAELVEDLDAGAAPQPTTLPVPVTPARSIPRGGARVGGDAAIRAQVLGERRGLRAGPTIHDEAKATYNKVEWSGSKDRRAPKGRKAKTEV